MGTGLSSPECDTSTLDTSLTKAKTQCLWNLRHGFLGMIALGNAQKGEPPVIQMFTTRQDPVTFPLEGVKPHEFLQGIIDHLVPSLCEIDYVVISDPIGRPVYLVILHNLRGVTVDVSLNGTCSYQIKIGELWIELLRDTDTKNCWIIDQVIGVLDAFRKGRTGNFGRPRVSHSA
jgi:hypothetical protein